MDTTFEEHHQKVIINRLAFHGWITDELNFEVASRAQLIWRLHRGWPMAGAKMVAPEYSFVEHEFVELLC